MLRLRDGFNRSRWTEVGRGREKRRCVGAGGGSVQGGQRRWIGEVLADYGGIVRRIEAAVRTGGERGEVRVRGGEQPGIHRMGEFFGDFVFVLS